MNRPLTRQTIERIESEATRILHETGAMMAPVPLNRVASALGIRLHPVELGDDISGVLVIESGRGTIGYNKLQSPVRQRFTIAHELGHYTLHKGNTDVFIDKKYKAFMRDRASEQGEIKAEIEVNRFAAALLMPASLIHKSLEGVDLDLGDTDPLSDLARQFNVSTQAMTYRLIGLRIISEEDLR